MEIPTWPFGVVPRDIASRADRLEMLLLERDPAIKARIKIAFRAAFDFASLDRSLDSGGTLDTDFVFALLRQPDIELTRRLLPLWLDVEENPCYDILLLAFLWEWSSRERLAVLRDYALSVPMSRISGTQYKQELLEWAPGMLAALDDGDDPADPDTAYSIMFSLLRRLIRAQVMRDPLQMLMILYKHDSERNRKRTELALAYFEGKQTELAYLCTSGTGCTRLMWLAHGRGHSVLLQKLCGHMRRQAIEMSRALTFDADMRWVRGGLMRAIDNDRLVLDTVQYVNKARINHAMQQQVNGDALRLVADSVGAIRDVMIRWNNAMRFEDRVAFSIWNELTWPASADAICRFTVAIARGTRSYIRRWELELPASVDQETGFDQTTPEMFAPLVAFLSHERFVALYPTLREAFSWHTVHALLEIDRSDHALHPDAFRNLEFMFGDAPALQTLAVGIQDGRWCLMDGGDFLYFGAALVHTRTVELSRLVVHHMNAVPEQNMPAGGGEWGSDVFLDMVREAFTSTRVTKVAMLIPLFLPWLRQSPNTRPARIIHQVVGWCTSWSVEAWPRFRPICLAMIELLTTTDADGRMLHEEKGVWEPMDDPNEEFNTYVDWLDGIEGMNRCSGPFLRALVNRLTWIGHERKLKQAREEDASALQRWNPSFNMAPPARTPRPPLPFPAWQAAATELQAHDLPDGVVANIMSDYIGLSHTPPVMMDAVSSSPSIQGVGKRKREYQEQAARNRPQPQPKQSLSARMGKLSTRELPLYHE